MRKVLVVDDDEALRSAVGDCVSALGVEALQARDGREALEILAASALLPDAILLDMIMPGLDGGRFLAALRADPRLADIPVMTMTGGPDPAPAPPIASRLHKPFDVEEVARILVSLCQ